jgi:hypothetical protein
MRRLVAITTGALVACVMTLAAPVFAQAESIALSTSAAPTEDVPMTITASGEADGSHRLFVYVGEAFFSQCAALPAHAEGAALAGVSGEALGVGNYTLHYSYTPGLDQTLTTDRACGYLDTEPSNVPDATVSDIFTFSLPSASVSFEVHPNPTIQNQSVNITASGTTEVARNLYVYVDHLGRDCTFIAENEAQQGGEPLADGQALNPGSYVEHYAYTPTYAPLAQNSYSLCGYVAPSAGSSFPDARESASFTVSSLQSMVEATQHAEQQAAKKAEEEAAAKKHGEEVAAANRRQEEAAAKKREGGLAAESTALLAEELTPSGKAAKIASLLKGGGFTVTCKALEAGTTVIDWYEVPAGAKLAKTKPEPALIAAGQRTFSAAGTAKIKIKLAAAGKRLLNHVRKLKLIAKGTFTPTGKPPVTATKIFVLKY